MYWCYHCRRFLDDSSAQRHSPAKIQSSKYLLTIWHSESEYCSLCSLCLKFHVVYKKLHNPKGLCLNIYLVSGLFSLKDLHIVISEKWVRHQTCFYSTWQQFSLRSAVLVAQDMKKCLNNLTLCDAEWNDSRPDALWHPQRAAVTPAITSTDTWFISGT